MSSPRPPMFRPERVWRSAREPLIWLDAELRVVWVNSAWEALTGRSAESIVGTICSASDASRGDDAESLAASFAPPPEVVGGAAAATSTLIVRPDGERLLRGLSFWPFAARDGSLLGMLGRIRDADEPAEEAESRGYRLRVRLLALRNSLFQRYGVDSLIGEGAAHRRLLEQARMAASSRVPLLIVGEPGTGKRHLARVIHQLGGGAGSAFAFFDCRAIPAELLERELFAAVEDDDASDDRPPTDRPRLAAPEGSTLALDDILELPRDLQARLAAALDAEAGEGRRTRVVAVTSGDLDAALRAERLRADLYHALSVFTIRLSPLRSRREDIPLLAQYFLDRANGRGGRQRLGFTPAAERALASYDWPGNLRELARVIERAREGRANPDDRGPIGGPIDESDLPPEILGDLGAAYLPPRETPPKPLDELLADVERRLIENAMARARRNKSRAAEILGVSRPRLYRRIKELGLPDEPDNEA